MQPESSKDPGGISIQKLRGMWTGNDYEAKKTWNKMKQNGH